MILRKLRYEASVQPGMHESYSQMFTEPRQEKLDKIGLSDEEVKKIQHDTLLVRVVEKIL